MRDTMAGSVVALVPMSTARFTDGVFAGGVPTWGETANLCPGEPFADQPAAAFCSGVLLDWDLVLTAGHCARVLAPEDMAVVFNYHYSAPGRLAVRPADVIGVNAIVAEALDPEGADPQLDYAWLRLSRPAVPPAQPAAVYAHETPLRVADSIVSIGSGGGVPAKLDGGGVVRDARREVADYFVADTDTSHGSSGGGGRSMRSSRSSGSWCEAVRISSPLATAARPTSTWTARRPRSSSPTRTARSKASAPFRGASSLCRPDCADPCQAMPFEPPDAGCSLSGAGGGSGGLLVVACILGWAIRRRPALERSGHDRD